jgi:hypothetical protein
MIEKPKEQPMNLQTILTELKREWDRLNRTIAALEESDSSVASSKPVAVSAKATLNRLG